MDSVWDGNNLLLVAEDDEEERLLAVLASRLSRDDATYEIRVSNWECSIGFFVKEDD